MVLKVCLKRSNNKIVTFFSQFHLADDESFSDRSVTNVQSNLWLDSEHSELFYWHH